METSNIFQHKKIKQKNQLIFFFPVFDIGGVEKNFYNISKFIKNQSKNLEICLITFSRNNHLNKNLDNNIKVFCFPKFLNFIPRRLKFIFCSLLLFFKIIFSKNILIFSFQGNFYAIIIAIILGKKIIIRSNLAPAAWSKNNVKLKIFKFLLSKVDKIIVNSDELKKDLENFFRVKCKRIYNPIGIDQINSDINLFYTNNFFQKNTINLINVGRLVNQKNQIQICQALSKIQNVSDYRLLILGEGDERNNLERYIKDHNLNKYIKIINDQKNKYNLMRVADAFILSSKNEGLPNVLLEAAVLKKYIISSNCKTGPREILKVYKNGCLYNKDSLEDLVEKIKDLKKQFLVNSNSNVNINKDEDLFNEFFNFNEYLKIIDENFKQIKEQ